MSEQIMSYEEVAEVLWKNMCETKDKELRKALAYAVVLVKLQIPEPVIVDESGRECCGTCKRHLDPFDYRCDCGQIAKRSGE